MTTYVHITGPYSNVGDSVIRRVALDNARAYGRLVLRVQNSGDDDWAESLKLQPEDKVTNSTLTWALGLLFARRRVNLLREPGEFNLVGKNVLKEWMFVLLAASVRVKGGKVHTAPRGLAKASRSGIFAQRVFGLVATSVLWRNGASRARAGIGGSVVPDIAFASPRLSARNSEAGKLLVLSLRVDRPLPDDAWFEAMRSVAEVRGLEIVALSQVAEDDSRSLEIAQRLASQALLWDGNRSLEQEERALSLYRRAEIVISDRLHVLVLALLEGAICYEIVPRPRTKVSDHLEVVGLSGISLDASGLSAADIVRWIDRRVAVTDVEALMLGARQTVEQSLLRQWG